MKKVCAICKKELRGNLKFCDICVNKPLRERIIALRKSDIHLN